MREEISSVRFISLYDRRNKDDHPPMYARLYYLNKFDHSISFRCFNTKWTVGSYSKRPEGIDDFIHFLITTLDSDDVPSSWSLLYATVSIDSECRNESDKISIQTIRGDALPSYHYGVCLHKAVGSEVQPQVLLDWVKLNIALGAQTITIYLQTVSDAITDALRTYITNGIVEILDWKVEQPFVDSPSKHGAQTGVIADCIYHNMNRVKYLALIDLDEFIVPQKYHTIPELLGDLNPQHNKTQPVASYVFWSANMYDNGTPLSTVSYLMKHCLSLTNTSWIPVYFKRTQSCYNRAVNTRKIIVQPMGIKTSWVHNILTHLSGYEKELIVPEEAGSMRHYRFHWSGFSAGCRTPKVTTFVMDQYVVDYYQKQCIHP